MSYVQYPVLTQQTLSKTTALSFKNTDKSCIEVALLCVVVTFKCVQLTQMSSNGGCELSLVLLFCKIAGATLCTSIGSEVLVLPLFKSGDNLDMRTITPQRCLHITSRPLTVC